MIDMVMVKIVIWEALTCLLVVFSSSIFRCSQGMESVQFGGHEIMSLIFADDVYLPALSGVDL